MRLHMRLGPERSLTQTHSKDRNDKRDIHWTELNAGELTDVNDALAEQYRTVLIQEKQAERGDCPPEIGDRGRFQHLR